MNRNDTVTLLARISAAYGRPTAKNSTVDEWQRQLANTDPADAHAALDRRIRSGESGPTLADLIALLPHRMPTEAIEPPTQRVLPTADELEHMAPVFAAIRANLDTHTYRKPKRQ